MILKRLDWRVLYHHVAVQVFKYVQLHALLYLHAYYKEELCNQKPHYTYNQQNKLIIATKLFEQRNMAYETFLSVTHVTRP